jgi:hypothetical protein
VTVWPGRRSASLGDMASLQDQLPGFEASLGRIYALFDSVPISAVDVEPRPGDWSVKQIACHLVDSASNNHQRWTRLQRTARLEFPPYEPEPWVAIEKPRDLPWPELLGLLKHYNAFLLHLIRHLDPACLGHVWLAPGQEKSLEFLVRDYYAHIDWHVAHLEKRIAEVVR